VTIIAGGAGITPFLQLVRGVMRDPADKTEVRLVYAVNKSEDLVGKEEFDDLEKTSGGRFKRVYVVGGTSGAEEAQHDEGVVRGRINRSVVETAMGTKAEWGNTKVLICGPDGLVEAVAGKKSGILKELGVPQGQVHKF